MQNDQVIIFIASDDRTNLPKLEANLRAQGYKLIITTNRIRVAVLVRSEVPAIVVLDLETPFDVCRHLKRSFVTEPIQADSPAL